MTRHQIETAWIIGAFVVLILAVDLGLLLWRGPSATISVTMTAIGELWPPFRIVVSLGTVGLLYHFFG